MEVYSNSKEGRYSEIRVYLPGEEVNLIDFKLAVNDVFILD
ncbi:hypothetical protein ADIS_3135 [Lunatimonas lonarensis]|uniref:Uncharacterized protein n=1 Tax=Lunatimonas lonarensis TaxID=1232681 RepID=R7ZRD4_9BACT|nr:hypothetical protein ADIS_3135 [Lunatimonas lonarensis]